MKKVIFLIITFLLIVLYANSQDYLLTQNERSMSLAPSFAGIDKDLRLGMQLKHNRSGPYKTYYLYSDYFFKKISSGIGGFILRDQTNNNIHAFNKIAINYTYELNINDKVSFRPAIGISFNWEEINFNNLVYGDQIGPDGTISPVTVEIVPQNALILYVDATSSFLFYNEKFRAGISFDHLIGSPNTYYIPIEHFYPLRTKLFGAYKFIFEKEDSLGMGKSIIISSQYHKFETLDLFDIRTGFKYNQVYFQLGAKTTILYFSDALNSNKIAAILAGVGVDFKNINFGLTYDTSLHKAYSHWDIRVQVMLLK